MKNLKVVVLIAVFLMFPFAQSYGQNVAAGIKIAYVDLSRIFDGYSKTKEYDAILEKKTKGYEQEHNDKLQKIRDAEGKLALLKEEEKNKLQTQIDKDKNDLLAFDRQRQTDLRKERDEKIKEILSEIEKVVKDFAEKENYSVILNDRILIYGGDSLNVTNPIIKLLNDKYTPPK